jgi:hypothetical protein
MKNVIPSAIASASASLRAFSSLMADPDNPFWWHMRPPALNYEISSTAATFAALPTSRLPRLLAVTKKGRHRLRPMPYCRPSSRQLSADAGAVNAEPPAADLSRADAIRRELTVSHDSHRSLVARSICYASGLHDGEAHMPTLITERGGEINVSPWLVARMAERMHRMRPERKARYLAKAQRRLDTEHPSRNAAAAVLASKES